MKNIGIIIIAFFAFTTSMNAQLLASLSTKTQGGVMGKVNTIVPQIGFHEADTDLMTQTMLFNDALVRSNGESIIFHIDAKNGGINFQNFFSVLKSHIGRSLEEWFETVDFTNEEIGNIELVITKVNFNTPGANRRNDGNWTDFTYEVTLNIYGTDTTVAQK
jgi:hypothetical protein